MAKGPLLAETTARFQRTLATMIGRWAPALGAALCRRQGLAGSPFDASFYQGQADLPATPGADPLLHYLLVGSGRGLRPTQTFDPAYYRAANPDVSRDGYEPFSHYVRFGRREGREGVAAPDGRIEEADAAESAEQTLQAILGLADRRAAAPGVDAAPRVDIVMPVYGRADLTLAALRSVLESAPKTAFDVVVVDDASPDPRLAEALRTLADRRLVSLVTNHRNLGFTASVNRGMSLRPERDIVLLNSDTRVFGNWLDRLVGALGARDVATATPLSNAATILSYPIWLRDNPMTPAEAEAIDADCARVAEGMRVDLPTGVGFCMAIRRRCLDALGLFDERRFPRGYGEENDFCRRATRAGWRHVAAADTFVWHRGGASFGADKQALVRTAQRVLAELHPQYRADVRDHIARDPLSGVRQLLDEAGVARTPGLDTLEAGSLEAPSEGMLSLVADIGPYAGWARIVAPDGVRTANLPRLGPGSEPQQIAAMMRRLDLRRLLFRDGARLSARTRRRLEAAARLAGVVVESGRR